MEWKPRHYEIVLEGTIGDSWYRILSKQTGKFLKPTFKTIQEAQEYINEKLSKEFQGD